MRGFLVPKWIRKVPLTLLVNFALLVLMSTTQTSTTPDPIDSFILPDGHKGPVTITKRLWESAGTHDYRMTAAQSIDGKRKIMLGGTYGTTLCIVGEIV